MRKQGKMFVLSKRTCFKLNNNNTVGLYLQKSLISKRQHEGSCSSPLFTSHYSAKNEKEKKLRMISNYLLLTVFPTTDCWLHSYVQVGENTDSLPEVMVFTCNTCCTYNCNAGLLSLQNHYVAFYWRDFQRVIMFTSVKVQ